MNATVFLISVALAAACAQPLRPSAKEQVSPSHALRPISVADKPAASTVLGIKGTAFTLNGKPTFLLGFSYYGGLGADGATWKFDLDVMQKHGFNWLRVWANWSAFDYDISAVDGEGRPREPYLSKLKALAAECDRRGLVVDVTLSRGKTAANLSYLHTYEAHRRAVETLVRALKLHRNWYLDLANERNIRDSRFTSMEELAFLRVLVKGLDPERLVTASNGGDLSREDVRAYLEEAQVDFLCPHGARESGTALKTESKTLELLAWMRESGHLAPVHYQEPFRRGYGDWQPRAEDFLADLKGARTGGAAGWCFHNGGTRTAKDSRPRRSFDLRDGPLITQLDDEEYKFVQQLPASGKSGKEKR